MIKANPRFKEQYWNCINFVACKNGDVDACKMCKLYSIVNAAETILRQHQMVTFQGHFDAGEESSKFIMEPLMFFYQGCLKKIKPSMVG